MTGTIATPPTDAAAQADELRAHEEKLSERGSLYEPHTSTSDKENPYGRLGRPVSRHAPFYRGFVGAARSSRRARPRLRAAADVVGHRARAHCRVPGGGPEPDRGVRDPARDEAGLGGARRLDHGARVPDRAALRRRRRAAQSGRHAGQRRAEVDRRSAAPQDDRPPRREVPHPVRPRGQAEEARLPHRCLRRRVQRRAHRAERGRHDRRRPDPDAVLPRVAADAQASALLARARDASRACRATRRRDPAPGRSLCDRRGVRCDARRHCEPASSCCRSVSLSTRCRLR